MTKSHIVHSMTGFGRGSFSGKRFRATVELRAVNGRFLEIRAKLPKTLSFLEMSLREILEKQLSRGIVDLTLTIHDMEPILSTQFDASLIQAYAEKSELLAKQFEISSGLTALALLKLPGVIADDNPDLFRDEPEIPKLSKLALAEALSQLLEMRSKEGEKLVRVIQRELSEVVASRTWIEKHRDQLNERTAKRMDARLKEYQEKNHIPLEQNRILQEVAFYLDRNDVTEELDRLASHLKQFEDALSGGSVKSLGKRLEFLLQELGREVNTIGAKSDVSQLTNHVVEMKLCLEKIREQVQNLE